MIRQIKLAVFLGFTILSLFPLLALFVSFVLYPAPHTVSQAMESVGIATSLLVIGLWITQLITQIETFINGKTRTRPTPILPRRMTRNDIQGMVSDAVRQLYDELEREESPEQPETPEKEKPDKDDVVVTSTRDPKDV